ncbi:MAG: hypothetical protein M3347_00250 [Armatimonadota bacterium]|nr:hypothetical protein [Armatimonadota bacterium]
MFRQHTAHGEPPVIDWGKDGKLVKQLLKLYSYERLVDLLEQFFASPDKWIRSTGYSLAAFKAVIGQLLIKDDKNSHSRSEPVTLRTGQWFRAGETLPKRYQREEHS